MLANEGGSRNGSGWEGGNISSSDGDANSTLIMGRLETSNISVLYGIFPVPESVDELGSFCKKYFFK